MRRRLSLLLLVAWAALGIRLAGAEFDPAAYLEDVKRLSSEKFQGRLSGTRELDEAAEFIASRFRALGLKPALGSGYLQKFRVTAGARPGKSNRLSFTLNGITESLKLDRDFTPLNLSASGQASGAVVFAGYGITAPEYGYDDYQGLDVRGKIVVILRHEPQEYDDRSPFGGRVYTNHAQVESKVVNAMRRGASAVILTDDAPSHRGSPALPEKLGRGIGPDSPGIPVVEVQPSVAMRWIEAAGRSLGDWIRAVDEDLRPQPFAFPETLKVSLSVDLRRETRPVFNVLGYLPGTTSEYVIVGAHYDHIGHGEQYSMDPSGRGRVHPGADDNASGTAGVLALARWFASRPAPRRGILFALFGGEEFGLLGSNYYLRQPALPLDRAAAMINLDMIGRIRDNRVYVGGTESSPEFKALVERLNEALESPFALEDDDSGDYGSSDHYTFTTRQIPFLFFFSGLHADYHTPRDTWDRVEATPAARLLELVGRIVEHLANAPERPSFEMKRRP